MGYLKSIFNQYYLKTKVSRKNKLGKGVILSGDTKIGSNCNISKGVKFCTGVLLEDNIKVGEGSFLSKIVVGSDSIIEAFCRCVGNKKGTITLGRNVYIGIANYLDNSNNISIGNNVQIAGPSTAVYTHTGAYMALRGESLESIGTSSHRSTAPVVIEDNVYIGCNCTIYPGITIGHHTVIAPNSAVTKDVEPYTMVGGVPAKFIKEIRI